MVSQRCSACYNPSLVGAPKWCIVDPIIRCVCARTHTHTHSHIHTHTHTHTHPRTLREGEMTTLFVFSVPFQWWPTKQGAVAVAIVLWPNFTTMSTTTAFSRLGDPPGFSFSSSQRGVRGDRRGVFPEGRRIFCRNLRRIGAPEATIPRKKSRVRTLEATIPRKIRRIRAPEAPPGHAPS